MLGKKNMVLDRQNTIVEQDMPAALKLLEDISKASNECLSNLQVLQKKVSDSAATESKGMSFLSVKNSLMLQYVADLTLTCQLKTQGHSVEVSPALQRLVEGRTVLEKMRPIESKLKYQINKVVRMYKEGKVDPSDPRKHKPNFGSFSNMDGGVESEDDQEERKKDRGDPEPTGLYRAPKVAPVHYDEEETKEQMMEKQAAKATRKKLSKDMIQEMREMYTDAPAEIFESDVHRHKKSRQIKTKERYEEENFMRLPLTKKEKNERKKMSTMSSLGVMANFYNDFDEDEFSTPMDPYMGPQEKKQKLDGKKGGKKKGGKKKGKKNGFKVFYK